MAKPREGQTDILVRLPAELHEAIKAKAVEEERSMAQQIRYVLRLHVGQVGDWEEVKPI